METVSHALATLLWNDQIIENCKKANALDIRFFSFCSCMGLLLRKQVVGRTLLLGSSAILLFWQIYANSHFISTTFEL